MRLLAGDNLNTNKVLNSCPPPVHLVNEVFCRRGHQVGEFDWHINFELPGNLSPRSRLYWGVNSSIYFIVLI